MTTRTRENELREVPLWRACDSGSSGVVDMSTATRRTLSCACAVKGNAAAARYTYECRKGTAGRLSGSHRCPRSPTGKHPLPVTIAPTARFMLPAPRQKTPDISPIFKAHSNPPAISVKNALQAGAPSDCSVKNALQAGAPSDCCRRTPSFCSPAGGVRVVIFGSPMAILFSPGGPPLHASRKPCVSGPYRPASRSTGSPSMHRWPVPPRKKSGSEGGRLAK
jgi:hypothetical protein